MSNIIPKKNIYFGILMEYSGAVLLFNIILVVLKLHCEVTVLNLIPIFPPETSDVWQVDGIPGPGTLQIQIDGFQQFNVLSVTFTCDKHVVQSGRNTIQHLKDSVAMFTEGPGMQKDTMQLYTLLIDYL